LTQTAKVYPIIKSKFSRGAGQFSHLTLGRPSKTLFPPGLLDDRAQLYSSYPRRPAQTRQHGGETRTERFPQAQSGTTAVVNKTAAQTPPGLFEMSPFL